MTIRRTVRTIPLFQSPAKQWDYGTHFGRISWTLHVKRIHDLANQHPPAPTYMERTGLRPPAIKIAPSYRATAGQIGLGPLKKWRSIKNNWNWISSLSSYSLARLCQRHRCSCAMARGWVAVRAREFLSTGRRATREVHEPNTFRGCHYLCHCWCADSEADLPRG